MRLALTLAIALALAATAIEPSDAQRRRDAYESREKASRDLIGPKYRSNGLGDLSIRRENKSLRDRLLLNRGSGLR